MPAGRFLPGGRLPGRDVSRSSTAGTPILHSVFADCFACGAMGWARFAAKRTSGDGTFSITVPLDGRGAKYRVSITGPNRGATLAPDAATTARSAR